MKTERITEKGNPFLKVRLEPVSQKSKVFYVAKIKAKDFIQVFTVEPACYDIGKQIALREQFPDDRAYYDSLIKRDVAKTKEKPFERPASQDRINKIQDFLNGEEYALFPNTIIVTCELSNDSAQYADIEKFSSIDEQGLRFLFESGLSFLERMDSHTDLYIPFKADTLVIIDGQHRIKGLKKADDEVKEGYELLVAFIIDVDRSVIARQFYTINYHQKPVNKSLLYHLSGEFSEELDVVTFLHEAVILLNELAYSPFFRRIKMLGIIPSDLSQEDKARMTVSQAFLIDYLKGTISDSAKESLYPPIFLYYFKRKDLQIEIIRFIIRYFSAIRKLRNDWEDPENSIICKTIGIGALIRVMHFIFVKIFLDKHPKDPGFIKSITISDISGLLQGIGDVDFSKTGRFAGAASSGSMNTLKQEIIEKIDFLTNDPYESFLQGYKSRYLSKYLEWLKHNT